MALCSVVVPVFNGERYLSEALVSVLSQVGTDLEVIVVDDGSPDASAAIADAFGPPVRVVRVAHGGIGAARNAGIEAARGELLAFLDADDLRLPGTLALQAEALAVIGQGVVFGQVEHFASPDLDAGARAQVRIPAGQSAAELPGTMLARRDDVLRVGPFRTDVRVGEFVDWMLRARGTGLVEHRVPDLVLRRRIHAANTSNLGREVGIDYLRVVRDALARRKGA